MRESHPGMLRTDEARRWKDDFSVYYEVEKGGMVNLNDLYMFMYGWFKKEMMTHYTVEDSRYEDFYSHKIRPDGVQENLIWWRGYRRINDFIYYFCKMDWQNFGAKQTEIMYDGKKVKTHKLGLVIRVWWWVQIDPWDKWEKSFLGKMAEWFYSYLLNDEQEYHRDKCRELARRQQDELKQFFNLGTAIPMQRSWFPEEGYRYKKPTPDPETFKKQPRQPDPQI